MPGNQQILTTSLRQEQQLSARLLQSLELLNLPTLELEERLNQELTTNPLLESELPTEAVELPMQVENPEPEDESTLEERAVENEEWADELPLPPSTESANYTNEENDFVLNSLSNAPTLQEQLLSELSSCNASPEILRLGEAIISALDDSGYFRSTLADLAMSENAELADAEAALKLIQSFDPPGIGCRDLAECLKLQLERTGELTPLYREILDHHLEEIARNHLPQLAKTLHITLEELNHCLARLRRLNPYPGSTLATSQADFVVPEVSITRKPNGEYEAIPRRNGIPRLFIAEKYLKLLESPDLAAADKAYLQEKLQQARELIHALDLRQSTITRIADMIIKTQRDFLDRGKSALKPLTMKQAGEMLNLHETTISRAAANKYVETPQGIYPFKFFFTAGFTQADGVAVSNRSVMEKIKELVDKENPTKPLSDEQIAQSLKAAGLTVARRTIAKYREEMNIPSSSLRRKHL